MHADGHVTHSGTPLPASNRHFPWLLSWHLLKEFALPLAGTLSAFVMLSLMLIVFDDLPDFQDVEISPWTLALYFLARLPENLLMAFPISALLAVSFMTIVLGKNNELTAIRSAGLSLLITAVPVWLTALLMAAGIFLLTEFIQPACIRYVETIQLDYLKNPSRKNASKRAEGASEPSKPNQLAYYNPNHGQEWFFSDFRADGVCKGVCVCLHDDQERPVRFLTAATAEYNRKERAWHFWNVCITDYDYSQGEFPLASPANFMPEYPGKDSLEDNLFRENPRDIAIQSTPMEQMSLKDLLRMRRRKLTLSGRNACLADSLLSYRLFSPLGILIAILLGFALTLTRGRTSPVQGFVTAVALFVGYYFLAQFFLVLGKNGYLWGPVAGALPTLAALAGALFLTYRRQ